MNRRRQPIFRVMSMVIALLVGGLAALTGSCPASASIPIAPAAVTMHMDGPCGDETSPPIVSSCLLLCQAVLPDAPVAPAMGLGEKLPPYVDRPQRLIGLTIEPRAPPPR